VILAGPNPIFIVKNGLYGEYLSAKHPLTASNTYFLNAAVNLSEMLLKRRI
jgi:hypothetical protein